MIIQPNDNASAIEVKLANKQSTVPVNTTRMISMVRRVVLEAGYQRAEISIAIVDDATIHQLNVQYLQHDYSTDVLSFVLEDTKTFLQGEIILSADTAVQNAKDYSEPLEKEMLRYAIHGALHLVGYDDTTEALSEVMQSEENRYLSTLFS